MLYLPNEYSPGVQAENLRVQDGRIALGDEVSALTEPGVAASPHRRGRPPPKAAAEQGLTEMRHVTEIKGNAERPQTRRRARVEQR
jgi:succinylarginine dihydrolase